MDQSLGDSSSNSCSIEVDYDIKLKIMLIGDANVGKTSLLKKYCYNEFSKNYISSIGIDFQVKYININKKKVKAQLWDTTGQERYQVLAKNFFNSNDGFIIVYDITNRKSYNNINYWVEQINESAPNHSKCVIFGNKNDLIERRQVELNEGKELGKKYNYKFFETSAKDGINLNEGFESLFKEIMNDIVSVKATQRQTISLRDKKHKKIQPNEPCC